MKYHQLSLLLFLGLPTMIALAQESAESDALLQAVALVLTDIGVYDAVAKKHPKAMQGCERYGALRMDFLPNDRRFKNELVALDSCLFGARPNVLFFENIQEVIALTDYKTKRSAYVLKFYVAGSPNAQENTRITSKVKRDQEGMRIAKVHISRKQ